MLLPWSAWRQWREESKKAKLNKLNVVHQIEGINIKPSKKTKWIIGLKAGFASLNAKQRDQYSWVAKTDECYVYTAEIDHIDKKNNIYSHNAGTFVKYVRPHSREQGDAALSISHAQELFDAVTNSFNTNLKCRLLLVKGTRFGKTNGPIKAAADGNNWRVVKLGVQYRKALISS